MKNGYRISAHFLWLLTLFLHLSFNAGLTQTFSRAEFRTRIQQAATAADTVQIEQLLNQQRGEAIRFIESLLDSTVHKRAGGDAAAARNDWQTAKIVADVYQQIFGDDFYRIKAIRFRQLMPDQLPVKAQILQLKDQATQDFYQGEFRAALDKFQQALPLAVRINDADERAAIVGNIGAAYFYLGEFDTALDYYQQSLTLLEALGDRRRIGNRLGNIATLYNDKSDYPTALAYYDKAMEIRRELDDQRGLAADLNNAGLIYEEMGNYDLALAKYQSALEINQTTGNERSAAKNLANIANVHINLGDYPEALQIYEKILPVRKDQEDRKGEGNDLGNMGIAYQSLGDYDLAMRHYQSALSIHREIGFKEGEAYQLGRIASLLKVRGDYAGAIKTLQEALNIHREMGHLHGAAEWLEELSDTYLALGDPRAAEAHLQSALALHREIGNRSGEASALEKLGDLFLALDAPDSARGAFEQARRIHRDLGERWGECSALIKLGIFFGRQEETETALTHLNQAKNLADSLGESHLQAWVRLELGETYRRSSRVAAANRAYQKGLAISEGLMETELRWQMYYGMGQLWEAQGDDERAYFSYRAAINLIEEIRRLALVEELKAAVVQKRFDAYQAMILLLARLKRTEEAFQYLERARARNLLDLLGNSKIKSPQPQYRELIDRERALQAKISTLTTQLSEEGGRARGDIRGPEEVYRDALQQAQREYQQLQVDLKLRNPEYAAMTQTEPLAASGIQALLDAETVLLEYFLTADSTFIFVITREGVHLMTVPQGMESLRGKIILFRGTAVRRVSRESLAETPWISPLQGLYRILVEPLQQGGYLEGKKHLIIVPQGLLHYLPFPALIVNRDPANGRPHFLAEDYSISYTPSASMLPFFREKNHGKRDNLLLLAPRPDALPMSETEIREISAQFGSGAAARFGAEASESLVKQQGINYDLLHFATTAHFNKINPMFSRVDMAGSGGDDGNLEVYEVFNLNLKANMVVLSACQTALGSGYSQVIPRGDDLVGLSQAFLYAGSASVVASLWEISDPSTARFMARFYENLRDQKNKAAALAQTQREMISGKLKADDGRGEYDYSHPYFWAAFVLIGDWE